MTVKKQVVQAHTERPRKIQAAQEEFLRARTMSQAQQLEECKKQMSLKSAKARAAVDISAVEGWASTARQHIQAALREGSAVQEGKGEGGKNNHKGGQISGMVGDLVA